MPQGDICSAANSVLFDHLVGACEQHRGHGEAENPGGRREFITRLGAATIMVAPMDDDKLRQRNGAIVIAVWHGVRHEKRRA